MPDTRINAPGAPTNPPHTAREGTEISDYHPAPAPSGAVPPVPTEPALGLDPRDPHPSDEGHPYDGDQNPRDSVPASMPRYLDIRPNPAIHTGTPEPKPDNADHGPKYSPG